MNAENEERLQSLLESMDVPSARRQDNRWLLRNLAIRNAGHENFEEAMRLIRQKLKFL